MVNRLFQKRSVNVSSTLTLTPIHPPTSPIVSHATSPLTWNTGNVFSAPILAIQFIHKPVPRMTFLKHKLDRDIPWHKNPALSSHYAQNKIRVKPSTMALNDVTTNSPNCIQASLPFTHNSLTLASSHFFDMPGSCLPSAFAQAVASAWNSLSLHYYQGCLFLLFESWLK